MAALLITTEVMVAEKTDKTASPMLNGGMAEGCIGPRVSAAGFFKPKETAGRTALSNAVHPVARELQWIPA